MSFKTLSRCAIACALVMPFYAHAAQFNAKPGLWEMTTTLVTNGGIIPAEQLAKMSPEQRAKAQEMMERSRQPKTEVSKVCITPEKLEQESMIKMNSNLKNCTQKIVSQSPSKIMLERKCPEPTAFTATMSVEAASPESMNTVSNVEMASGGKMHMDVKGRWLSANCEAAKNP